MKVAMIGLGKLGLPCAEVMSELYEVVGYDISSVTASFSVRKEIKDTILGCDLIFIAVPTPHDPEYGGSAPIINLPPKDFNYSIVKSVLSEVNNHATSNQLVVLISTVLPGTTRKELEPLITNAKFIYNPYLIAMGSVKWDMVNPECLIIGTKDGDITGDAKLLVDFYKPLMKNSPPVNIGTWDEAEAIKIFYNTFISAKIGLVNMIQDVAEKNKNINVDVVTTALKNATHRITGPRYLTAGMGDGGACHPRDNIALRWLAQELNLGYDLFHAIMESRDAQAKNKALKLIELSKQHNLPIVIHGRSYKPLVPYTDGSYSELIAHFITEAGFDFEYVDPLTEDNRTTAGPAIFFLAHNAQVTYSGTGVEASGSKYYCDIPSGSIILDPWRTTPDSAGITVLHYGNTRMLNNETLTKEKELKEKIDRLRRSDPFIYR
jgi:UDPglucose 6-dehydrogenase